MIALSRLVLCMSSLLSAWMHIVCTLPPSVESEFDNLSNQIPSIPENLNAVSSTTAWTSVLFPTFQLHPFTTPYISSMYLRYAVALSVDFLSRALPQTDWKTCRMIVTSLVITSRCWAATSFQECHRGSLDLSCIIPQFSS